MIQMGKCITQKEMVFRDSKDGLMKASNQLWLKWYKKDKQFWSKRSVAKLVDALLAIITTLESNYMQFYSSQNDIAIIKRLKRAHSLNVADQTLWIAIWIKIKQLLRDR